MMGLFENGWQERILKKVKYEPLKNPYLPVASRKY